MSLKGHDDAKNKIEKMQSMVSPDQQIFLSSLSTGSEVTVAEGTPCKIHELMLLLYKQVVKKEKRS